MGSNQEKPQHFIYDYAKLADHGSLDFEDWKRETIKLTDGMTIAEWSTFITPLKTLGTWGEFFMRLMSIFPIPLFILFFLFILPFLYLLKPIGSRSPFSSTFVATVVALIITLSYHYSNNNFQIEHSFITFKLVRDDKTAFASLEKIQKGTLFQFSREFETLRDYAKGAYRGAVERKASSQDSSLEKMLMSTMVSMNLILDSKKLLDAFYNVFTNNCQQTVSRLMTRITETSLQLEFRIPGTNEKIAICDNRIVNFLEQLHPKWVQGEHQQFPEVPDPFALIVNKPQFPDIAKQEIPQHQQLIDKQRMINAINQYLQKAHLEGRKAVFSKLDRKSLKDAFVKTQLNVPTTIDQITAFWNAILDILVVLDDLGVIIFHFADDTLGQSKDCIREVEQKMEIVSKVGDFPDDGKNLIHAVIVSFEEKDTKFDLVMQTRFGKVLNMKITSEMSEIDFESCISACFEKLHETSKLDISTKPLHKFVAKLFILQNMENKDFLIHKQEFGPKDFVVLTPSQKQIVDEAREKFRNGELNEIRWIIQGCFGSGKTLILMQLVKEFIKSGQKGNVSVFVPSFFQDLTKMLQELIRKNGWQYRVFIGHESIISDNVKLLLWDEFWFSQTGPDSFFKHLENKNLAVILCSSQNAELIRQVKSNYFPHSSKMKLLNGNLRSSVEISTFVAKYQQFVRQNGDAGEPVISSLNWKSTPPKISLFQDDSNDRDLFLQNCAGQITKLAAQKTTVMVSVFAHGSLTAKLEKTCESQENVSFGSSFPILGCQYQCVVVIMDLATCMPPLMELIHFATRATTSLHIILNASSQPSLINRIPSFQHQFCLRGEVESKVSELISGVETRENKVAIDDHFDFLQKSFFYEMKDTVVKKEAFWSKSDAEIKEETKDHSLVIEIIPARSGLGSVRISSLCVSPYYYLSVAENENELSKFSKAYDHEITRKGIVDFLISYRDRISSSQN